MPSEMRQLVSIRGEESYGKALGKLLKAVQRSGVEVDTLHQLGTHALEVLAQQHGVALPARSRPHGTNRYTVDA